MGGLDKKTISVETRVTKMGLNSSKHVSSISTPVYRASTIAFPTFNAYEAAENGDKQDGITYGLQGLPTVEDIQDAVARLEGAYKGLAVPSGLTATTLPLLALLNSGDHILMVDNVYSPTRRFCENTLKRFNIVVDYYDPTLAGDIEKLFLPNTKLVYLESPGSLTFEMQDIPAIVGVCQRRGILTVLDNTWATPLGFRAFDFNIDVSVHAATKFIGGHSDLLLGIINCNQKTYPLIKRLWTDMGVTPSPDDCFLAMRGLRTLPTRLKRHEESGLILANWIKSRPEVSEVFYPALPDDMGYSIWKRDYQLATGVFSFILHETDHDAIARFFDALTLIKMGWSWGGFTSLITYFEPSALRAVTHWRYQGTALRLAVGLEHPDDLIKDLTQAFKAMRQ